MGIPYNCWEIPFPPPNAPEVLVLYRKRADGTSLRSGRYAARRAFDTAPSGKLPCLLVITWLYRRQTVPWVCAVTPVGPVRRRGQKCTNSKKQQQGGATVHRGRGPRLVGCSASSLPRSIGVLTRCGRGVPSVRRHGQDGHATSRSAGSPPPLDFSGAATTCPNPRTEDLGTIAPICGVSTMDHQRCRSNRKIGKRQAAALPMGYARTRCVGAWRRRVYWSSHLTRFWKILKPSCEYWVGREARSG